MAGESTLRNEVEDEAPDDLGWFIDESITDAPLEAHEEVRVARQAGRRGIARVVFISILAFAFVVHAVLILAFLYRDAHQPIVAAQMQETPVEVVVEKPPEPLKPPPPQEKKPEPPKLKEDLSPALSAPRAPTEEKVKTETKEAKTAAPNQAATPTQGQQQAAPAVAPPKDETKPAETKKEDTAKEEDKSKPDAEALDKARPKAAKAKQTKTKEARSAPKRKQVPNAIAALEAAPKLDAHMSVAKPTPKAKVYGGTEDMRWMALVEGMLVAKVTQLPRTAHWRDGGQVVIFFHVDVSGRVLAHEIILKSGYPDIDAIAMRALALAAPFPPPPPGLERGLYWASTFDGQLPVLHVSKR